MKKHLLLSSAILLVLAGFFYTCTMKEEETESFANKEIGIKSSEYTTTQYFFYYNGEKQYLEIDTKYIFVSVADENTAGVFASKYKTLQPLREDIPKKM